MAQQFKAAIAILRRKQVEARTGLSRSSIYKKVSEREFPEPVQLGARAVGWIESEVEAWLLAQVEKSRKVPDVVPPASAPPSETAKPRLPSRSSASKTLTKPLHPPKHRPSLPTSATGSALRSSIGLSNKGGRRDE